MFFEIAGEVYRVVLKGEKGIWAVSYDDPKSPQFISFEAFNLYEKVKAPYLYKDEILSEAQKYRMDLIRSFLDDTRFITDSNYRRREAEKVAKSYGTTPKRILHLYYTYLSKKTFCLRKTKKKTGGLNEKYSDFKWAIETFYFSAKKMSLRMAYDLMLTKRYMVDGKLLPDIPSWESFRHYYYSRGYHRNIRKSISRNGLSAYQRQERILYSNSAAWKDHIGVFQMDATEADIYLVSRFDRGTVIGRPYIYLAVDTVSQLIAGIYIGLKNNEDAVMACLANAAENKVSFCRKYGIEIQPEQWPSQGLPGLIVTDQGKEFLGGRVDELCKMYGVEREALPPFRPDCKGIVEKAFDLIQQKYKPLLRGKGVIESDAQERWAIDYRSQAILNLTEFTQIILHCVIYINSYNILKNRQSSIEMIQDVVQPIPAKLWLWYEKMGRSEIIPVEAEHLYLMTLKREKAILTRRGIQHEGLFYISNNYKDLLQRYGMKKEVMIAYDSDCSSYIYIVEDGQFTQVPLAPGSRRFANATELEHNLFEQKEKEQKKALRLQETEANISFLQNVMQITDKIDFIDKKRQKGIEIAQNRKNEEEKRS